MRLRQKLLTTLILMLLLMLVPSVLAVLNLRRLEPLTEELLGSWDLGLDDKINKVIDCQRLFAVFKATHDRDVGQVAEECADAFWATTDSLVENLEKHYPEEAEQLRRAAALYAEYSTRRKLRQDQERELPPQEATQQKLLELLQKVEKREIERRRDLTLRLEEANLGTTRYVLVFSVLGAIFAFVLASLLDRQISGPLGRLLRGTKQVAMGRFDQEVPASGRDEIGELTKAFNQMSGELATLDRMKAEFIHIASHELKSPATTLKGYVDLLNDKKNMPPAERRVILDEMNEEVDLLIRYIDQFMEISRMETGRLKFDPIWIPTEPFFQSRLEEFRPMADRLGIELTSEVEPEIPEEIRIDVDRISQVTRNLLENAFQYTPEGGKISIRLEPDGGGHFLFSVRDTGPGVPPGEEERIFEKYVCGGWKKERGGKGSGLGLAISRAIVEGHDGRLWVEPGAPGAVFRCRLPVRGPRSMADPTGTNREEGALKVTGSLSSRGNSGQGQSPR